MKKLLVSISFLFFTIISFGQGATCPNVEPFCAGGSSLTFNNQTGVPSLGTIGCNGTTPNPAWFYLQIGQGGNLNFQISQTSNAGNPIDVDFIAWGPFPPGSTPADFCPVLQTNCAPSSCPNNTSNPNFYPNGNIIDCSYSGNAVENMTITGAQAGEIYVVLITNFNGAPGQITMTQTNILAPNAGTTDCNIVCPLTLGEDQIICPGGAIFLEATIADAASYAWFLDGVLIPSATSQSYIATQTGTYTVVVNKPGCVPNATSSVILMDPPAANIGTPNDLEVCGPGPGTFNLNSNSGILLNGNFGDVTYHLTLEDAQLGASPIGGASNYSSNGQTIYAAIQIDGDPCIVTSSFDLIILDCTLNPQPTNIPGLCDANGDGFEIFDLTQADANALNGLPASQYTVTYHNTFAGATTGTPFITNPATYNGTDGEVIYIRVQNNTNATINGTTQITLTVIPVPTPDTLPDVTVCDSYVLPTLTVGNYFTGSNGTGVALVAGQSITTTTLVYIYAETDTTPNCFAETSFTVTV
ncbi:MAG: hypothetical protein Q8K02_03500, partial [Flavobacterium sp.]|nr:hypothetical protein [Flavobacterium sp.]